MTEYTPQEFRSITGLTTADVSRYARHGYIRPHRKNPEVGEVSGNVFVWTERDVMAAKAHELLASLYTGPMLHLLANVCADAIYGGRVQWGDTLIIPKPEVLIYRADVPPPLDGPQNLCVLPMPDSV